jgi:flagellin
MIINTNVSSLVTRNYLRKTNDDLQATMEKLSSGKRINKAADDAAGLAISTRMTTQITGMNTATRNANDGVSLIQTAESAMGSISDILQRMRELAVQADNGTYSGSDRTSLKSEMDALVKEIDHISSTTNFNGISLLDGTNTTVTLHISDLATDTLTVGLNDVQANTLGFGDGTATLNLDALDITSATGTLTGSDSGAQDAIKAIDGALNQISGYRADLGAMQNRLNFTVDNLAVANQNTTSARSRIEDADMAAESSEMTRNKILTQSSIAMLAQANQNPQQIMQLLQG